MLAAVVGLLSSPMMIGSSAAAVPDGATANASPISVTPGAVDRITNGNCSIREAIDAANTDAPVDACTAGSGTDTIRAHGTFVLTTADNDANGLPVITSTVTISDARLSRGYTAPAFRIIEVASTGNLTLDKVTISGGVAIDCPSVIHTDPATVCGGAIANAGTLNVNDSKMVKNAATNTAAGFAVAAGGAISNTATVHVRDSRFSRNTATCSGGSDEPFGGCFALGGAVFNSVDGTLYMNNSEVDSNAASCSGDNCFPVGGAITNDGTSTIHGSRLKMNTASCTGTGCTAIGGGIGMFGTVTVTRSQVIGNTASCSTIGCLARGGGLDNCCEGTLNVNDSRVAGNNASAPLATARGGGLMSDSGTVTLTRSSVTGNTASGTLAEGGGIFKESGSVTLNKTKVVGNTPNNCTPPIGTCS